MPDNTLPRRRKRPRTGKQALASARAEQNRTRALRMRLEGHTTRQIGAALGVDHSTAADYINQALTRERGEQSAEAAMLREIEHARLEMLLQRLMPLAMRLDVVVKTTKGIRRGPVTITVEDFQAGIKACDTIIKISARIAALYGLDAPRRSELGGVGSGAPAQTLDQELEAVIAKAYGETAAGSSLEKIVPFPASHSRSA